MNKIFIALGIAVACSTAALADSGALDVQDRDVQNRQAVYSAPAIDTQVTASIGQSTQYGVESVQNRARFGDGSPMVGGKHVGSVPIETGYLPAQRLGGNS